VEPTVPVRPVAVMRYKIEDGKDWFILDRETYALVRDYIISLEGTVEFAVKEIQASNGLQDSMHGVPNGVER